ncbi:MAG TPA: tRNA glutamyl-Q(34) synthetase GluQRS [Candidatus Didemnitutus sp.]|nr:tRNA glutamyl-Q(34) synthetase GluQRS [Candidatus Didemnitutus sp.]
MNSSPTYRGRLAPSPTGYLHLGHARTFWVAQKRGRDSNGSLILRNEDVDGARCRPEFVAAMLEDLRWFGFSWGEGPDVGGPHAPYDQSQRLDLYGGVFDRLRAAGHIYPCTCSRKDVQAALHAPHEGNAAPTDEPLYPGTCRPENLSAAERAKRATWPRERANWRLRAPDGEHLTFIDGHFGRQRAITGRDFGDFLVWRKDNVPSYQLACVADDHAMQITEVVRGADLLLSTFRQLLLYRALGLAAPAFYHCPLVTDEQGVRLAKRHDALALRTLRAAGRQPEEIRASWK